MLTFRHRRIIGGQAPLKPGRYTEIIDLWHVDRQPRVGETCTAYIDYVRQVGQLVHSHVSSAQIVVV